MAEKSKGKKYRWSHAVTMCAVGYGSTERSKANAIKRRKSPLTEKYVFSDHDIELWIEWLKRLKSGGDLKAAGYAIAYIDMGEVKEVRDDNTHDHT